MAKKSKRDEVSDSKERPEDAAEPGAGSLARDPEAELNKVTETLGAIRESIAGKPVMNESDSKFLMSYGRFLSGVVRDRRIGNVGKLAGRSLEEMIELAKTDPDIREAIEHLGLT